MPKDLKEMQRRLNAAAKPLADWWDNIIALAKKGLWLKPEEDFPRTKAEINAHLDKFKAEIAKGWENLRKEMKLNR